MEILFPVLLVVALLIYTVGAIWFLVAAFRESIWWGLACLLLPIVQLFFLIVHWDAAKKPFGLMLLALLLFLAAILIATTVPGHPVFPVHHTP